MSEPLPKSVRSRMVQVLWTAADSLNWPRLSDQQRAVWYENWAKDKEIGGVLAHYMDARRVRVYIKDSLLKPYMGRRLERKVGYVLELANIPETDRSQVRSFRKPQGLQLSDGSIICWGNARDWKAVVLAAFERSWNNLFTQKSVVVLLDSNAIDSAARAIVDEAARRLRVGKLIWSD